MPRAPEGQAYLPRRQGPGEQGCLKDQMLTTESSGQPAWSLQQGTVLMGRSLRQQLAEESGDGM